MNISNTWKARLRVAASAGRHLGFAALVITSSISGIGQAWRFFFPPPPPPIAATQPRRDQRNRPGQNLCRPLCGSTAEC